MTTRTKAVTAGGARSAPSAADAAQADAEAAREAAFNDRLEERAELLREANALRDMMLAQLKADDDVLKKYIAMI